MSNQAKKQKTSDESDLLTVLIPDAVHADATELLQNVEGVRVLTPGKLTQEELEKQVVDVDALLIRSGVKITKAVLAAANRLKIVARAGVGVDNIDLAAATEAGVVVVNTPGGNTESTAQHTFALLLAVARRIPDAHASLKGGAWARKQFADGVELSGKTLAVVGLGRIGRRVAVLAQAFGMTVTGMDPYVDEATCESLNIVKRADFASLLADADFVTLHTVLTDETRNLICAESLASAKKGLRVVNAARGALIDEQALAAALDSGVVAGAALDVFATEPPPADHPLIGRHNVVHTPHLAASTPEAQRACGIEAAELVRDALLKNKFANCCNRDVLEKISQN